MSSRDKNVELLQGTLDLIILRGLCTMGPLHSYALATGLAQVADHPPERACKGVRPASAKATAARRSFSGGGGTKSPGEH